MKNNNNKYKKDFRVKLFFIACASGFAIFIANMLPSIAKDSASSANCAFLMGVVWAMLTIYFIEDRL